MSELFQCVVVDGPNFICRLMEQGLSPYEIADSFSVNEFHNFVHKQVVKTIGTPRTTGLDFFCSTKRPGPKNNKLTRGQMDRMLKRFSHEPKVTVHQVALASQSEKGVDIAIAAKLFEYLDYCETFVLVSSNKDFVPALETLKRKAKYVVTFAFSGTHPIELINLSYHFIEVRHPDFARSLCR